MDYEVERAAALNRYNEVKKIARRSRISFTVAEAVYDYFINTCADSQDATERYEHMNATLDAYGYTDDDAYQFAYGKPKRK